MNNETKNIETDLVVEDAIFAELARTRTLRAPSGETRTIDLPVAAAVCRAFAKGQVAVYRDGGALVFKNTAAGAERLAASRGQTTTEAEETTGDQRE